MSSSLVADSRKVVLVSPSVYEFNVMFGSIVVSVIPAILSCVVLIYFCFVLYWFNLLPKFSAVKIDQYFFRNFSILLYGSVSFSIYLHWEIWLNILFINDLFHTNFYTFIAINLYWDKFLYLRLLAFFYLSKGPPKYTWPKIELLTANDKVFYLAYL